MTQQTRQEIERCQKFLQRSDISEADRLAAIRGAEDWFCQSLFDDGLIMTNFDPFQKISELEDDIRFLKGEVETGIRLVGRLEKELAETKFNRDQIATHLNEYVEKLAEAEQLLDRALTFIPGKAGIYREIERFLAGKTESEPCRIYEHDGAYICHAHSRVWGAVLKSDPPCPGWKPE